MNPLYMNDPYLCEFEALVEEVTDEKFVVLNQTAFFPKGGGQLWDEGVIIDSNGIKYNVIYVGKFSGKISHEVDKPGLKLGAAVKCLIDWERRYRMMRMHTAAHLISALINIETSALITGGQLGLDHSRIDFNLERFDKEKIERFIGKANALIKEGREVKWYFLPREEVLKMNGATKLADISHIPDEPELRVVEIVGIDKQMDGGTHVKNIKEIGNIKLLKIENKGKNNRRLYYTVE